MNILSNIKQNIAGSFQDIEKAHVKTYTRTSKSGKTSMVKEHDDKRLKKEDTSGDINKMTRAQLEGEIIKDKSLYKMFNEKKLLDGKYTDKEYREIISKWIEDGDETEH